MVEQDGEEGDVSGGDASTDSDDDSTDVAMDQSDDIRQDVQEMDIDPGDVEDVPETTDMVMDTSDTMMMMPDDMVMDTSDTMMMPDDMMMGGNPIAITWPPDPTSYANTAQQVSYITSLQIPASSPMGAPTCCKDFGARSRMPGQLDNALAALNNNFGPALGLDINTLLQEQIELTGALTMLWDHRELDTTQNPDDFVLVALLGAWAPNTTYATASMGQGQFLISRDSFDSMTQEPLISFNPATISNGTMSAGPGNFVIALPLLGFTLQLDIQEAEVFSPVAVAMSGLRYSTGTLSGYVLTEDIRTTLNSYISSCACTGVTGDLYTPGPLAWGATQCSSATFASCASDPSPSCQALDGFTSMLCSGLTAIPLLSDIDADSDGQFDALSVGLQWSAEPATIVGVQP